MAPAIRHFAARLYAFALAATLTGCMSINLGASSQVRALDYLNDDIASLVLAFDVPQKLETLPERSVLRIDAVIPGQGERHIVAALQRADADAIADALPPPGAERSYYIFALSELDQAAIREAQDWARQALAGTGGDAAGSLGVTVSPVFCAAEPFSPQYENFSVLIALPGADALEPLISRQRLDDFMSASGIANMPECESRSG
jgi:hypothetical protein